MNTTNINNVRKSANLVLAARKSNNNSPEVSMNTKTNLVTRNDVQSATQGEKAEAYAAAYTNYANSHAGMSSYGDPAALAPVYQKRERTGVPINIVPSGQPLEFHCPTDGLVGNILAWNDEKECGEIFFGRSGQKSDKELDAYEKNKNSVLGVLNVLRSFIINETKYSNGILTNYAGVLTGKGYTFRKGSVAYVKGYAVKHLLGVGRDVKWRAEYFADNRAYKVMLNQDGSLYIHHDPTNIEGSPTAAEGWRMKFMVAAALESGTGIRLSIGKDTKEYAVAIMQVLNGYWQLENNKKLSESAKEELTNAVLEVEQKLRSEYWETVGKKEDFVAQKRTERKVERNLNAENGPIVAGEEKLSWFNGQQVHVTVEMLMAEIEAGRPIVRYSSKAANVEPDGRGYVRMDLRRQNLTLIAEAFNSSAKTFRRTYSAE